MAVVAQLVEPRIVIPVVEGSNPFSRPTLRSTEHVNVRCFFLPKKDGFLAITSLIPKDGRHFPFFCIIVNDHIC